MYRQTRGATMRSGNMATRQQTVVRSCSIQTPAPHPVNTSGFSYAQSFVRIQSYNSIFDPAEALCEGTLFPELNRHFC